MADVEPDLLDVGPSTGHPKGGGFGLATATFLIVSSMIGVGVLTTSGHTVLKLGSNQLMLALWAIGGVVALCVVIFGLLTFAILQLFGWMLVDVDHDHLPAPSARRARSGALSERSSQPSRIFSVTGTFTADIVASMRRKA